MERPNDGPGAAPSPEPTQPVSKSEAAGWYDDGPKASDATSNTPGQDGAAAAAAPTPDQGAGPSADDRKGGSPDADKGKSGEQSNLLMDGVEAKRALARVYADFKAENFEIDKGGKSAIDAVTKLLDKALDDAKGNGELNHQDLRDTIVKHGVDALKQAHDAAGKNQRDVWNKLNDGWKNESRNDPDIGGPKLDRSLGMAKGLIEEYGGSKEQQKALMAHINNNGMGNYAGFIRLLANIGQKMNVFEDGSVPGNPSQTRSDQSRSDRWYGGPHSEGR